MARFVARFLKHVLGENGHEAEICQRWVEVEADNEFAATELAKQRFCQVERLKNWTDHADRIQVAESEFPS